MIFNWVFKDWRKYISPSFLKFEKLMLCLKLHSLVQFLKIESKEIYYDQYKLIIRGHYSKNHLSFYLYYIDSLSKTQTYILHCVLENLNTNNLMANQCYWQSEVQKQTNDILPKISFVSVLHQLIRTNRDDFSFIKAIYSTSTKDINGYSLSDSGYRFWEKQVANKLAAWIDEENRFKSIFK